MLLQLFCSLLWYPLISQHQHGIPLAARETYNCAHDARTRVDPSVSAATRKPRARNLPGGPSPETGTGEQAGGQTGSEEEAASPWKQRVKFDGYLHRTANLICVLSLRDETLLPMEDVCRILGGRHEDAFLVLTAGVLGRFVYIVYGVGDGEVEGKGIVPPSCMSLSLSLPGLACLLLCLGRYLR